MKENLRLITSFPEIIKMFESGVSFCAFDTESTGIDVKNENLIELGAVKFSKYGIQETFQSLVSSPKQLSPFIKELTGLNDEILSSAPAPAIIIPKFTEFIAGTVLVAHNAQFDLRLVNAECERLNIGSIKNKGIDTLRLSRILSPENQCWKLSHLSAQFNLQTENFHRAYDDALCCAKLFLHLLTLPLPKKNKKRHAEMKM